MIVELIDDFFAEYPATAGSNKVDTAEADEVIDAIAKTFAEMTSQQDGAIRQQLIEDLMMQSSAMMPSFAEKTLKIRSGLMHGTRSLRSSAPPKRRRTPGSTGGYDDQAAPLSMLEHPLVFRSLRARLS
jgi:hypothetical protein